MTNQQGRRPQNSGSRLLTKEENEKLFYFLSKRSVSQAAAVVQIYETYPSPHQWNKKGCGVACFIKDNEKRSFFIRVYDLWEQKLIWEHEIYNNLKYESQCPFFHFFASEEFWVGLNFCNEEEAENFKNVVLEKLHKKAQRRENRRRHAPSAPGGDPNRRASRPSPGSPPPSQAPAVPAPNTKKEKEKAGKKKKDKKLNKADISRPTNFLHVGHVGWDPTGNWQVGEEDELKTWCKNLGIDEDSLKDMATVNFIKEFIDQNGGIEAVKREGGSQSAPSRGTRTGNLPPPPPPNRELPAPPSRRTPLPPTPTNANNRGPAPPPPPPPSGRPRPGGMRPPPPAAPPMSTPPPPPPSRPMSSNLPPPPPAPAHISNGPPPPPPPPMGGGGPPPLRMGGGPPPPPPPPPAPSGGGGRGNLLSDIRSGTTLKTVTHDEQPKSAPTGRDALLEAIRGGKDLKKVEAVEKEEAEDELGGLGSALLNALSQRSTAIHDDDSEDEEFDDEDDEWDD